MKLVLLANIVSPHQMPFARKIVERIGSRDFRYVYTEALHEERENMGWEQSIEEDWCIHDTMNCDAARKADTLLSGYRAIDLFRQRVSEDKLTCYMSERWFKPPVGILRLLSPAYFKMALEIVRLLDNKNFFYFPMGIHAARDMIRLYGLLHGDLRCLFCSPVVAFESKPCGTIVPLKTAIQAHVLSDEEIRFAKRYGFVQIPKKNWGIVSADGVYSKIRLWGYFVAPSELKNTTKTENHPKKILWVGRMLDWKMTKTLVKAVLDSEDFELNLYGHGPMEGYLKKVSAKNSRIKFHDYVPIDEIRSLMREHDIYVLASNGYEGWGAVLSEALEEQMCVLASIESGSGATMLPSELLFESANWKQLAALLNAEQNKSASIGAWSAENAAKSFFDFIDNHN